MDYSEIESSKQRDKKSTAEEDHRDNKTEILGKSGDSFKDKESSKSKEAKEVNQLQSNTNYKRKSKESCDESKANKKREDTRQKIWELTDKCRNSISNINQYFTTENVNPDRYSKDDGVLHSDKKVKSTIRDKHSKTSKDRQTNKMQSTSSNGKNEKNKYISQSDITEKNSQTNREKSQFHEGNPEDENRGRSKTQDCVEETSSDDNETEQNQEKNKSKSPNIADECLPKENPGHRSTITKRRHSEPNLKTTVKEVSGNDGKSNYFSRDALFDNIEDELRRIFNENTEKAKYKARKDLMKILDSSFESDCSPCHQQGSRLQNETIADNRQVGSSCQLQNKDSNGADCRMVSDTCRTEEPASGSIVKMTKMEHFKKRLIHQHEKPTVMPTQVEITLEEHESPSPTSSTSSGPSQDKKKEEVIQKVVRKRAVCRSKFRHRNLELFKLGNSIPTSLCKTKEPYNVCTGRNLQMCCETQQNGKKDENCSSSSLTQAIINSIEGSKNSDPVLSTSISLNNEKKLKPKTLNNEVDKTISTGRHNLPLIISELTERKTNKFSNNKPKSTPENNETVIKKTEPISIINRRKSITQRRKTVTGSETTLTSQNEIDIRNVESRRNKLGNPLAEGRRGPVNNTVPQTNPICLSPEDLHINRRRTAANNKLDLNDQGIINRKTQEQRPHPQLTCYNATDLRNMIDIIIIHMTHEFTIDNLMTLNRYYLILHPYMFHPNCKEELRTSIFKSLTQVVLYLSDKLFGTIEDVRLNSYVTSIMQCDLLKHRQLLEVYVPKLNRYRHDDAWMMDFIRMLSQPSMTPAVNKTSNNRHRRGPEMVVNNPIPQNSMYTEPLPAHPFLHSRMANNNMYSNQFLNGPQNLFQTLQPFPPPLPYDVHRFTNPLPGNLSMEYLINLSDYQQFNINRSKNIRSDGSYLADNRCVPPHYNHMLVSNGNRHPVNDIDIMHPRIPGNAANYAPVINKANEVRQRRKNVIQSTPKEPPPLITSVIQDVCYQQRSQIQPPNISQVPSTVPNSGKLMSRQNSESSSTISTVSETNVGPDVEDHLQTNVILNQSRVMDTDVNTNILDSNKPVPENLVVERITQINLENTNTSVGRQTKKSDNTFLYKDCAMEITRAGQSGNSSRLKMVTDTRTKNDTIIERIDVGRNCDSRGSSLKSTTSAKNGEGTTGQEMEVADTDTDYEDSIEEVKVETSDIIYVDEDPDIVIAQFATMPRPKVASPTSMKGVQSLKRKDDGSKEQKEKKLKGDASSTSQETVTDDHDKTPSVSAASSDTERNNSPDCNQNYIKETENVATSINTAVNSIDINCDSAPDKVSNAKKMGSNKNQPSDIPRPVIEDISDEDSLGAFGHLSTYDSKVCGDPKTFLKTSEVTPCTLIEGNASFIKKAVNRHHLQQPLVYTKPVTPQRTRRHSVTPGNEETSSISKCLADMVEFSEDSSSSVCHIKVKNPSAIGYSIERRLDSPIYQASADAASHLTSPRFLDPRVPPVISSPGKSSSSSTAVVPIQSFAHAHSAALTVSPIVHSPPRDKDIMTIWKNRTTQEQHRRFFNFERLKSIEGDVLNRRRSTDTINSVGSDCSNFNPVNDYCELKTDLKVFKIKRSVLERIPKGKMCYIRDSNTLIRYFDDSQMELFLRNLNLNSEKLIISDLLKQIKGCTDGLSDIETLLCQFNSLKKTEIIKLPKDVQFSAEDKLSQPEFYIQELEKAEEYIPRDFFAFYKYVTGYQIVHNHTPISFQMFLIMHNTNGIRDLFKSI